MVSERLEIRLDLKHKKELQELAGLRGRTVSDVIRELIDQAYEDAGRVRRLRLVEELGRMQIGNNPDPETLSRELEAAYDIPDPYADERYQRPLEPR